jgi:hypothetical protein
MIQYRTVRYGTAHAYRTYRTVPCRAVPRTYMTRVQNEYGTVPIRYNLMYRTVPYCTSKDNTVLLQEPPPDHSTHSLPMGAGGVGLTSLGKHASDNYLGALFRIASPLQKRLATLGGPQIGRWRRDCKTLPRRPTRWNGSSTYVKLTCKRNGTKTPSPRRSYTHRIWQPPRGTYLIFSAVDRLSVVEDLQPIIETYGIPTSLESTAAPKKIRFVAA